MKLLLTYLTRMITWMNVNITRLFFSALTVSAKGNSDRMWEIPLWCLLMTSLFIHKIMGYKQENYDRTNKTLAKNDLAAKSLIPSPSLIICNIFHQNTQH